MAERKRGGFQRPVAFGPYLKGALIEAGITYGEQLYRSYKAAITEAYDRLDDDENVPITMRKRRRIMTMGTFRTYLYILRRLGWIEEALGEDGKPLESPAHLHGSETEIDYLAKIKWIKISVAGEASDWTDIFRSYREIT